MKKSAIILFCPQKAETAGLRDPLSSQAGRSVLTHHKLSIGIEGAEYEAEKAEAE
jgi:hypothetical protein